MLADQCYQRDLQKWFYTHTRGSLLTIVKPKAGTKGFQVQQWRWLVERSFAWLGNFRRLDLLHNLKMKEEFLGKMMLSAAAYSSI
ncbi:hypothetical protein [Candidatus Sarmatiella mevalonica]|uniref:hypothetical protein n=1 Tax=Candidatus Sarmatiella mevalonica TaxID=2770581 RepID=UPI003977D765